MISNNFLFFLCLILFNTASFADPICDNYAKESVRQYQKGMTYKAPGIVAPVWSNDYVSHKNWCKGLNQSKQITVTRKSFAISKCRFIQ